MHLGILSGNGGWHVRDLERAAAARGHRVAQIDFRKVHASLPGISLAQFDAVIVRTMPAGSLEQVVFRMDMLHRLQAQGRCVLNPPRALEACIDKYLASALLDAARLPIPRTVVCQDAEAALAAFRQLDGDVIVKPMFGSEGRGMVRVTDVETAWRIFSALERMQAVLYLQEFIRHPGYDVRAFVLDGRVLGAMRRHGRGDWRTNVAQGGRAEPVRLTAAEEELALRASEALGARAAGVDLLPTPTGGHVVLEVNAVPGWRTLAPTVGVDVADAIIASLE